MLEMTLDLADAPQQDTFVFLAQHVKVRRPARRGEQPAVRAEAAPTEPVLA